MRRIVATVMCCVVLSLVSASSSLAPASAQFVPPVAASAPLAQLLPTSDEAPAGLIVAENGARTASDIALTFPDPIDAAQQLASWGWQNNVYRTFVRGPNAAATTPSRLEISLHRFSWPTGAAWALPYFAHGRAVKLGQAEVPVALMRPDEAAVIGPNEATRYVRVGVLLIRVTAVMPESDSAKVAAAVATTTAEAVLANAGLSWPTQTCR